MRLSSFLKECSWDSHHISMDVRRSGRRVGTDLDRRTRPACSSGCPVRNGTLSLILFTTASAPCHKKADCLLVSLITVFKFPRGNELPYYLHPGTLHCPHSMPLLIRTGEQVFYYGKSPKWKSQEANCYT